MSNPDTKADAASADHADVPPLSGSSKIGLFIPWKPAKRDMVLHEAGYLLLGIASLTAVTGLYFWLDAPLASAAFTYLVVLVLLSLVSNLSSSVVLSFIGVCCLSYFFAPPIYSFRVEYSQDLITISAFVITSFVVDFLVTRVRIEQRDHLRTSETLRDANQRLEATINELRVESLERTRTEEALQETEYKLRQVFEKAPGFTWSTCSDDVEGQKGEEQPRFMAQLQAILNVLPAYTWYAAPRGALTFVNTRTAAYLGIPSDHPLRFGIDVGAEWDHSFALLHPDDREDARKYWSSRLRTGEGGEHSYRVRSAQGDYRWFLTRMEPLRASDGTLLLWVGATLDIDELKCTEEALRRSEVYLTDAQRLTHTGSWAWDPRSRRVLYCSDEMRRIFGLGREDVPSRKMFRQRVHPDDRDWVDKRFESSLHHESEGFDEYRIILPDGTLKYVCSLGHAVFDSSRTMVAFVGTAVDVTERKRGEEALRESEYKLRQIIETVPSHLWSADPNFEPTHLNRHLLDYFGKQFEEFRHGGWEAFIHPDDLPETAKAISHAVQTGTYLQVVHRLRRADGEFRWHHARGEPLRDQEGRIIQWYGLSVDIDEGKKAEDRLRRSEAHLAEAQRLSHTGASVFNETTILYWSDETYRIWGFDPAQGIPSREAASQRIHPDDQGRVRAEAQRGLSEKRSYSTAYRIVLPDGATKHIESIAEPVFSAGGEVIEILATQIDVTERKRAQQALRRNEAELIEAKRELQQTIDIIPVLIDRYGADGKRDFVNAAWKKYTGLSDEAALGTAWSIVAHPDDIAIGNKMWRDALVKGEPTHVEARLRRADGQYRWFWGDRVPLRDESGKVIKWYSTGYDIEDRKRAEDLLRRSEAHLAEAQRLSHTGAVVYNGTAILFASEETYRIWGFDPAQGLPSREAVFQRIHPDDRDWLTAEVRREVAEKRKYAIGYRIILPDGTVKHLETIGQPVFSESGKLIEIFATQTDVTERKRAEERLRVQHTVAQILAEAGTIEEATPRILLAMGECLGWDVGLLWRVEREAKILRCVELWHNASIEVPEFERASRNTTFGPGLGLPGRVWSSLVPQYIPDVVADENFPRAATAEREGLRAAFGFPILLAGEVLGVIEFFSRSIKQPDQELLNMLSSIGSQIGQFIERERGEEALRESEAKFRDYAETASDWFWETDPDHKFTRLTEDERRLARGFATVSRIGVPRWEFATDVQSEPEKWELHRSMLEARQPFRDFVYRATRSDGSVVYNKISGKPVFDANGEFRGYRGTGTDVTEITRAQEALRESERRSSSALDGIAGLVAVLAANGELETVNRQVFEYFGQSLEWLKNWGTNDAAHAEDLPRVLGLIDIGLASARPFNYEIRLRRFDGEYRWFDTRWVPLRDDSGRVARWYALLTDIEDRTRALARLEQMQSDFAHMNRVSMMGELAASLSHEITQPIAAARNYARAGLNFLGRQPPDLGEVNKQLGRVVDAVDRSGQILERIRDHVKKAPPRKARFDLNQAIHEVIALGRSAIAKNGVFVQTRLAEDLAPVQGDRVQVQQVVLNLVLNAVEAMGSVGEGARELLISTQQNETMEILVEVRDSGPGIDPENIERVFEAFYTTKMTGIGMGLSICRSIIDSHGGRLWATMNEPRGAVFQFTLPRS